MKAYIFPGQGAQFTGMGKDLFDNSENARSLFAEANGILGFDITKIMFEGSVDDLRQTKVTQPAVFLHSVILASVLSIKPDMVAGHSLGELSALVASGAISFSDGLSLVSKRAMAMQKACEANQGGMAAIIGLPDEVVEEVCENVKCGVVVPANYNCPGQLVISGSQDAIAKACVQLKAAGAKRALPLVVGGAFHSPLMAPAREELAEAIAATSFSRPVCPVYQNVSTKGETDPEVIKQNLVMQLTSPVKWTQCVRNMIVDGASEFIEVGPGKVLQGLVGRICKEAKASSAAL